MTSQTKIVQKSILISVLFLVIVLLVSGIGSADNQIDQEAENMNGNADTSEVKYFDPTKITTININISESNLSKILNNPFDEEYKMGDIRINNDEYPSVGIRTKGKTSLTGVVAMNSTRFSLKIKADEFIENQTFNGLTIFALNNNYLDSSSMREYLSYTLLREMGVPTPLYTYAAVYINGTYIGLYLMVEVVKRPFAERNFGESHGIFYKPEDLLGDNKEITEYGDGRGVDLRYVDDNISTYSNIFDTIAFGKSKKADKIRVISALKNLSEGKYLESTVNVDEVLRYFAITTALVNTDSYLSDQPHNYYLYEKDGQLSIIPWDWNLAFGGALTNSSEMIDYPIDTPVLSNVNISDRPMIGSLLAVDSYKELYHTYLRDIAEKFLNNSSFTARIDTINNLIKDYVKTDPTAFYTFNEYQAGITTLKYYGTQRSHSILSQLNGTIPSTWEGQNADSTVIPPISTTHPSSNHHSVEGTSIMTQGTIIPTSTPTSTINPVTSPATPTREISTSSPTRKSPAPTLGLLIGLSAGFLLTRLRR